MTKRGRSYTLCADAGFLPGNTRSEMAQILELSAEGLHQVAQFIINLVFLPDRVGYFLPQQLTVALAQTMDRDFQSRFAQAQFCREGGIWRPAFFTPKIALQ